MLNNVTIMGRLTAEPEIRLTSNEIPVCNFSIAVQRPKKKDATDSEADFFSCVAWRGTAEIIEKYFVKGSLIVIQGHLRNHAYLKNDEKRWTTQIIVDEVHFTGERKKERSEISNMPDYDGDSVPVEIPDISDDDIQAMLTDDGVPF